MVDYNTSTLESSLRFTLENDDLFLGVNTSIFETLKESYNDKYEYFLPEVTLDKNLVSNRYGNLNLQSNLKVHNYDTNKTSNFLTNDFNWVSKNLLSENGVTGQILGNIKNINYSTKNIDLYKDDSTNELFGALGYLAEIDLEKNSNEKKHLLTPKMLVRYSPGSMRKESDGARLGTQNAFYLNRLNDKINNYETGLTATLGFDYKLKGDLSTFDFF